MNESPISPYTTFLKEAVRFHSAIGYLLVTHIAVLKSASTELTAQHNQLEHHVQPTYADPRWYFTSRLFISHIAAFEIFLQRTVSEVVRKHPKKVGEVEFRLSDILDASCNADLIQRAIDEQLNKLMYKKPNEYLKGLGTLLSIDTEPLEPHWRTFVEAKARRDLGVHNDWRCNNIYLKKLNEAGIQHPLSVGDSAVPQDPEYLEVVTNTLDELAFAITYAVFAKHWPEQLAQLGNGI